MVSLDIAAVRAAVKIGEELSESAMTATARFYDQLSPTPLEPVLVTPCRVKKPKPSSFDAGNQTVFSTKRNLIIQISKNALTGVVKQGLTVQVETPDGDPSINHVNFTVQSALDAQFSAARNIAVTTEVQTTPRIPHA